MVQVTGVVCDSSLKPLLCLRVHQGRCVICGSVAVSDAYYCKECTQQEKDRDGCPKIINLGSAKTDLFYERKKYVNTRCFWQSSDT